MYEEAFMDGQEVIESLEERITGRYAAEELVNKETGEVIVSCVPGSPIDCAAMIPTASPTCTA